MVTEEYERVLEGLRRLAIYFPDKSHAIYAEADFPLISLDRTEAVRICLRNRLGREVEVVAIERLDVNWRKMEYR